MKTKKILLAALVLFFLAGISFGQGRLSFPVKIASVGGNVRWTHCAFASDGALYTIWEEDNGSSGNTIWCASYNGVTVSTPFNVSAASNVYAERPHVSAGRKGLVGVTWGQSGQDTIYMRIYDHAAKSWGPVEVVQAGIGYSEPILAIDDSNNIFAAWFDDRSGIVWSKAKINGTWEAAYRLSSGVTSKQCWIASAKNGWVWCIWREKRVSSAYTNFYSKRTISSSWADSKMIDVGTDSMSHPFLTIHPDNTPYAAVGDVVAEEELGQKMFVQKIDEVTNPSEMAIPYGLQHYPQMAITPRGDLYLVCQIGGGDFGDGLRLTSKPFGWGTWTAPQVVYSTYPKVIGISADTTGNIGVSYSDRHLSQGGSDIWVDSIQKIVPTVYAPVGTAMTIRVNGLGHNATPSITYRLSWAANPLNEAAQVKTYNLYIRVNNGDWTYLTSVGGSTLSSAQTFNEINRKCQFAISAVAASGRESDMAIF
jgi:hypothetical protein